MKILFYTTAIEHSTFRKTAKMLQSEGAEVKMIGYTRKNFPFKDNGVKCEIWGEVNHGNYFKRLFTLFATFLKVRKESMKYDVLHCFTLDTLILLVIANSFRTKKIVYQIQDIRTIFFDMGLKGKIASYLERKFLKKVDLLIVSSEEFYQQYFLKRYCFPIDKVIVIENKIIETEHDLDKPTCLIDNKITIGYFGVLRCNRSWDILKRFAELNQDVQIYIRGKVLNIAGFDEDIKKLGNVSYGGSYVSPDDLAELYSKVSIVWAAYPYNALKKFGNWKMARTIRFYESGAFKKPMILQKGTVDAKFLNEYEIGFSVDMNDVEKAVSIMMENISKESISKWQSNLEYCPKEIFINTNEYATLFKKMSL